MYIQINVLLGGLWTLLTESSKEAFARMFQDVDTQLRNLDEKQNIDMSLVMGSSLDRTTSLISDQTDIVGRPAMRLGRMRTLSTDLAAVGNMVSITRASSMQSKVCPAAPIATGTMMHAALLFSAFSPARRIARRVDSRTIIHARSSTARNKEDRL